VRVQFKQKSFSKFARLERPYHLWCACVVGEVLQQTDDTAHPTAAGERLRASEFASQSASEPPMSGPTMSATGARPADGNAEMSASATSLSGRSNCSWMSANASAIAKAWTSSGARNERVVAHRHSTAAQRASATSARAEPRLRGNRRPEHTHRDGVDQIRSEKLANEHRRSSAFAASAQRREKSREIKPVIERHWKLATQFRSRSAERRIEERQSSRPEKERMSP
jgi:hypothetical protein